MYIYIGGEQGWKLKKTLLKVEQNNKFGVCKIYKNPKKVLASLF